MWWRGPLILISKLLSVRGRKEFSGYAQVVPGDLMDDLIEILYTQERGFRK